MITRQWARPRELFGLTVSEHRRLADILIAARRTRRAVAPLTTVYPELTVADATRVRDALLGRRLTAGERLIGAKVTLSPPRRLGSPQPRLGWLTDGMLLAGAVVDPGHFIAPRVEPKLAFVLTRPIPDAVASLTDVLAATVRVAPCLEIVDSSYGGLPAQPADDVADNCATSAVLIGDGIRPPAEGSLRRLRVELRAGAFERTATVGSSLDAVSWLADRVSRRARDVGPMTFLLGPAAAVAVPLLSGTSVTARFASLGTLELRASA